MRVVYGAFRAPAFRRVVEAQVRQRLAALVTDDVAKWCRPSTHMAYGKPYREILNTAPRRRKAPT